MMIYPGILISFLPWIVFAISSSFFGLKIGALIGLALQIAFFIQMARKRTYTILEAFSLVFFVIRVVGFLVLGEQGIEDLTRWPAALGYVGLAIITWATIALGGPFTRQYARRTTPKEWWTSELFLSSTFVHGLGCAVAFLGATVLSIIGALTGLKRGYRL